MGRRWVQLVMSKHDKMKFSNRPTVPPEILIYLTSRFTWLSNQNNMSSTTSKDHFEFLLGKIVTMTARC